jgi:hypothetical protein
MGQETSEVASFCGQATTLLEQKLSGLQVTLEQNQVVILAVAQMVHGEDGATDVCSYCGKVTLLKQNLLVVALVVAQDGATVVSSCRGPGTLLKQNLLVVALVVAQMVHGDDDATDVCSCCGKVTPEEKPAGGGTRWRNCCVKHYGTYSFSSDRVTAQDLLQSPM